MIKKIKQFFHIPSLLIIALTAVVISGCSSQNHTAAPVTSVEGYQADLKTNYVAKTYKVKKGETLYAIAWRTNQDFKHLASLNGIKAPYHIFPGQVLTIKGKSVSKSVVTSSKKPKLAAVKTPTKSWSSKKPVAKKPVAKKTVSKWQPPAKKQVVKAKPKASKPVAKKTTTQTAKRTGKKKLSWSWPTKGKLVKRYSNSASKQKGLSIAGPAGRKIVAAESGRVVYSGSGLRGYGNLIIIKHNDDYLSAYAYNRKLLVKEKQWVKEGQQIATMGNSGPTANTELYFEIRYRGKPVNPIRYLPKK